MFHVGSHTLTRVRCISITMGFHSRKLIWTMFFVSRFFDFSQPKHMQHRFDFYVQLHTIFIPYRSPIFHFNFFHMLFFMLAVVLLCSCKVCMMQSMGNVSTALHADTKCRSWWNVYIPMEQFHGVCMRHYVKKNDIVAGIWYALLI